MSATVNLAIPLIQASQDQKEVTHSSGMALLDAALTETLAVSVASGNATPTSAQYRACSRIAITGATTAGRTVTLPALKRPIFVSLDAASTRSVSIVRGTASFTLFPGVTLYLYTDGTPNGLLRLGEAAVFRSGLWVRGVPAVNEVLWSYDVEEPSTLLPDLLGWRASAGVAAAASTVFQVRRGGTQIGSITFAASGTVATLSTTSGAAQSFAVNETIDIRAPSPADAALADVRFRILIVRN